MEWIIGAIIVGAVFLASKKATRIAIVAIILIVGTLWLFKGAS